MASNLIVRVKRRREDDPAETICIFQDDHAGPAKKKKSLADEMSRKVTLGRSDGTDEDAIGEETGNPNITGNKRSRLVLQRVSTLSAYSHSTLDIETAAVIGHPKRASELTSAEDGMQAPQKRVKLIVAQSKKSLALPGSENACVIVDTMQIYEAPKSRPIIPSASLPAATVVSPTKTKILDPPTRLLAKGINTALQRGDFNDLSAALIQGADPDYRTDDAQGGNTALMVSVQRCNLRMVKRLLLRNVDVLVKNKDGLAAVDLIQKETPRNRDDYQEIRILLQNAAIKQHQHRLLQERDRERGVVSQKNAPMSVFHAFTTEPVATTTADDFVVDIYTVQQDVEMREESGEALNVSDDQVPGQASQFGNAFSVLRVDGLRIDESTGQVELVAYDSDWSDLADDEDPDSNDERHYANDYPEESDEDNGGRIFSSSEDNGSSGDDAPKKSKRHSALDASDSEDEAGEARATHKIRQARKQQKARSASQTATKKGKGRVRFSSSVEPAGDVDEDADDETADAMDNDEEEAIERDLAREMHSFFGTTAGGNGSSSDVFDTRQRAVGRVMRPFQIGEDGQTVSAHTTESLQALWQEDDDMGAEVTGDDELLHRDRIQAMRQRTNMVFAANAQEFNRETGLPKYGADLSDDEHQLMDDGGYRQTRPDLNAVAYDSELDRSDSD